MKFVVDQQLVICNRPHCRVLWALEMMLRFCEFASVNRIKRILSAGPFRGHYTVVVLYKVVYEMTLHAETC